MLDEIGDRTHLTNGRFLHTLSGWSASGASYLASDGSEQYGIASLPAGASIEQRFAVPRARTYTVRLMAKPVGGAFSGSSATLRITDGAGNTVTTQNLAGAADAWSEQSFSLGLAPGTTYTLRIINASIAGGLRVDDVWVWWVPKTRAQLAAIVAAKISRLAADRGYVVTPSGGLTEGDYTYAVDAGLRSVGAIDEETDLPDVRRLDTALLDTALDAIERAMLEKLQRDYALEVDIGTEQRRESLSQVARALAGASGGSAARAPRGGSAGGGRVVVRSLRHRADDFSMGDL